MWRLVMVWFALSLSISASAQSIEPASSADYKRAMEATERSNLSEAFQLFDRSCTNGDAAGCDFLATLDRGPFMLYGRKDPAVARADYSAKAARLYGPRCSSTASDAENCQKYARFLGSCEPGTVSGFRTGSRTPMRLRWRGGVRWPHNAAPILVRPVIAAWPWTC